MDKEPKKEVDRGIEFYLEDMIQRTLKIELESAIHKTLTYLRESKHLNHDQSIQLLDTMFFHEMKK